MSKATFRGRSEFCLAGSWCNINWSCFGFIASLAHSVENERSKFVGQMASEWSLEHRGPFLALPGMFSKLLVIIGSFKTDCFLIPKLENKKRIIDLFWAR